MNPLTFAQERLLHEIKIRGQVMVMAVDLEMVLLRIFLYCLVQTPDETIYEFKSMVLEQKIAKAKQLLKETFPEKLEEYKQEFKELKSISLFRNKFAHCFILWDKKKKDISYFNLLIITEIEEKERFQLIKMTLIEFVDRIEKMRKVIIKLGILSESIEDEFNYKYPN